MKSQKTSLFWPFAIISVGLVISTAFMVYALKNYKKPKPLVIKPSSVKTPEEMSESLYKALYPLNRQGFGVGFANLKEAKKLKITKSLKELFPATDKNFLIKVEEVKLEDIEDIKERQFNCSLLNRFHLNREKEDHWDKFYYFSVCRETPDLYVLTYLTRS